MTNASQTALRGDCRINEPMSKHTSWAVGGIADRFYRPADLDDFAEFLGQLQADEPLTLIGLGSNLLVRDGGVRGTVLSLKGVLNNIQLADDSISVEAGVTCAKLAKTAAANGFANAAFLAGIPGTIGGALAMNAGAHGGEIWDYVTSVTMLNRSGELKTYGKDDFEVAYRHVAHSHCGLCFVGAELRFPRGEGAELQAEVKRFLEQRAAAQPIEKRSCGSVFTNPVGDFAARLIECSDLKGFRIGGAEVSQKHANFILNTGGATAADIEALISHVKRTVAERQGVELNTEVRMIGEVA